MIGGEIDIFSIERSFFMNNVIEQQDFIMPFENTENKEYYIEKVKNFKKKPIYSFFKRLMDFFASLIGLLLLWLPMLIIAIIIKCSSKGPAIYSQVRLGKHGKPFKLYKFRSMVVDAEAGGAQWSKGDEDPRITKVGHFLRKTRLDELPQLWNIFIGQMSLVGPRPEREIFYNEFEKYIHGFKQRLLVKPGLTGHAQVNGGYDLKPEEKILLDIEYIKKRSLWFDIKVLFKTVLVVFNHKGAK